MMRKSKAMLSLLLAMLMMLALGMTALAADSYTITAPDNGHQYEIYQIFTGDLSDSGVLSNVKWGTNGTGITGEAVSDEILTELTALPANADAANLKVIEKYVTLSNPVATIGKDHDTTYTAAAGYYLIKDVDGSVTGDDAYTQYLVKVVKNTTISPKSAVPSFEKKLKDTNDTTGETSGWQDSADYDIDDVIPFKLTGTVAQNYAQYAGKYYFAFHDKEETGLTFQNVTSVYVLNGETKTEIDGSQYQVVTSGLTDGCSFEVIFNNLKNIEAVTAGSQIVVEYSSKLNDQAVLGKQGNVNSAKLEFSNSPSEEQEGDKKPSTGETPWDNVIVFTYKVVIDKYANSIDAANKLTGAEFTLSKKMSDGTTKDIAVVKSDNGTSFTFKGLDDGDYVLKETTTPAGYNSIADITFTVTAAHDIEWTTQSRDTVLTSLTGKAASGEITFTPDISEGSLTAGVVNKSGATLPETGGIGTTIFYAVGAVLVACAGILLVTKARMRRL